MYAICFMLAKFIFLEAELIQTEAATWPERGNLPGANFHAFRHTHASQLIAAGPDVLTISRRLGHGSPTITLGVGGGSDSVRM